MAEREKQRPLDELLDSLLATYSDAEPRPGMEKRLLATLRAVSLSANTSQRLAWRWLLAGAAAGAVTAVVVFAVYWRQIPATPQLPRIEMAGPPPPLLYPAHSIPRGSGQEQKISHAPRRDLAMPATVADVRQEIFPSPTPLSEQERLLMRYLASTPRREVAAHSHKDEPMDGAGSFDPQVQRFNEAEGQTAGNEDTKEKL
jgi:hypothetical protein